MAGVERASVEAEPSARVGMLNQAPGEFSHTDPHAYVDARVLVCELGSQLGFARVRIVHCPANSDAGTAPTELLPECSPDSSLYTRRGVGIALRFRRDVAEGLRLVAELAGPGDREENPLTGQSGLYSGVARGVSDLRQSPSGPW
jgi:hypothetical protein